MLTLHLLVQLEEMGQAWHWNHKLAEKYLLRMCSQAIIHAQCLPEENSTTMLHAFYGDASHIATRLVASTYMEVAVYTATAFNLSFCHLSGLFYA